MQVPLLTMQSKCVLIMAKPETLRPNDAKDAFVF